MPWNFHGGEAAILWVLWVFFMYLFLPIVLCWVLFGYAWLRGWLRPDSTPAEILGRILK